jgi:hypothetical protein
MRLPFVCLTFASMTACHPASTSPDLALAPDLASGCGDPARLVGAGCGALAWTMSPVASRPRNHHVTVLHQSTAGAFLHVLGGLDMGTSLGDVDRVEVLADGSLGTFVPEPRLPLGVGGHVGAIANGTIVVAGGMLSDRSWSARLQPDGSLVTWVAGGSVLKRRMHGGAIARKNSMCVMGGFDTGGVWDDIVCTSVNDDGTLAPWAPAGTLPGPRSHFSVELVDGYVYVVGGFDTPANKNPPNLKTVSMAALADDGGFGPWTAMPDLPIGKAAHASFYYGGYLYVAGGLSDALLPEDTVFRAPIAVDHTLGPWEPAASLPIARGHVHQLPVKGDHVYSIAGAIDSTLDSTAEIDIASF